MELFDIPEGAIDVFERIHRLRITVHDLRGSLWPHLRADRFHHAQSVCQAVKMQGAEAKCNEFDIVHLRRELPVLLEGRFHVCHAGLVEWVVPVFERSALAWVLFAGARSPGETLRGLRSDSHRLGSTPAIKRLELVETSEAETILEHLRQLAARLERWATQVATPTEWPSQLPTPLPGPLPSPLPTRLPSRLPTRLSARSPTRLPTQPITRLPIALSSDSSGPIDPMARRRIIILRFIQQTHVRNLSLAQLAEMLAMSPSRASHVIRETCGSSFRELLVEARLKTAMGLLRATDLSVLDVSVRSGFTEVAHFHRIFRTRVGLTPRKYRVKHQT